MQPGAYVSQSATTPGKIGDGRVRRGVPVCHDQDGLELFILRGGALNQAFCSRGDEPGARIAGRDWVGGGGRDEKLFA